jgi:cytochrome P450
MAFERIDTVWPFDRDPQAPLEPPPLIKECREKGIVTMTMYDGAKVLLATSYEDVREIAVSPRISSNGQHPNFPYISAASRAGRGKRPSFDRLDPPEHDLHRGMISPTLTVKRVREMRPYLEGLVERLLDRLEEAGPGVDLVSKFAEPIPAAAIARLLGLPEDDIPFFIERTHVWMNDAGDPAEVAQAASDINKYFERVFDERTGGDGGDLISKIIREHVDTGHIDLQQFLYTIHLLIAAGFDTTANVIVLGTLAMLRHPTAWAELAADTENALVPGAVEEILRYTSVAHTSLGRVALEQIPIGHEVIPAGQGVIGSIMGANYDPEKFPEPERLDIHRDARAHLAFGVGIHQCVGQALARLELATVFERLPKRFPRLKVVSNEVELEYRPAIIYGLRELKVGW